VSEPERALRTISPSPGADRPVGPAHPERFAAWPEDTRERAFELWSTAAVGSAPRTEYLLAQEVGEGVAIPAASTIRRWASEDGWAEHRDRNLEKTQGRTLRQLQATSLAAVALAQQTMLDAMIGLLDLTPYAGAPRVRAAEAVLRLAERSGIELVVVPAEIPAEDDETLSLAERARRMREKIQADNERG
jgi:hypothetical protein